MAFLWPEMLWLLLIVPGLVLAYWWLLRRKRKLAVRYASLAMVKDAMGVAVPASRRMVALPPALLVPCLGFNPDHFRLGYGGGYYDRTLEHTPRPFTLGIAYACQAAQFTGAAHDVALDRIITELG